MAVTDNLNKAFDVEAPFHRIESPDFNTSRPPPDGRSTRCRRPEQSIILSKEFLRAIPAWTPVVTAERQDKELEGKLVRSFQTWTDFPLLQWHQWYDWNFHVDPSSGFTYLRGAGNDPPTGGTPLVPNRTMECEWDTGAFSNNVVQPFGPGAMFFADWAWPMTGQRVWVRGTWIYDCGHSNTQGLFRTELHPCRAVATARWEAVRFSPDAEVAWPPYDLGSKVSSFGFNLEPLFVPAIQFMFFASRFGGYIPNGDINDRDYKFIVDLPTIPSLNSSAAITKNTPQNLVAQNPKLVWMFDSGPFQRKAKLDGGSFGSLRPIVTAIDPGDGSVPKQAIVELPLSKLPQNTDAYGVIVSVGYVSRNLRLLADLVRLCTVTLNSITVRDSKGLKPWVLKFGVNGRWNRLFIPSLVNVGERPIRESVTLALPVEEGRIFLNTHGKAVHNVGEFLKKDSADRRLSFLPTFRPTPGQPIQWDRDVVRGSFGTAEAIADALLNKLAGTADVLSGKLKDENEPLGITDKTIRVKSLPTDIKNTEVIPAPGLIEVGTTAELVFASSNDYTADWIIELKDQP